MKTDANGAARCYQKGPCGTQEKVWSEFNLSAVEAKEFIDRVFPRFIL